MFDIWKLKDFAPGDGLAQGAFSEGFDDHDWLDVPAPGDVHRALIAAGRIEDPFYDQNETKCAWIEDREWWYRLRFEGPSQPLRTRRAVGIGLSWAGYFCHSLAQRRKTGTASEHVP